MKNLIQRIGSKKVMLSDAQCQRILLNQSSISLPGTDRAKVSVIYACKQSPIKPHYIFQHFRCEPITIFDRAVTLVMKTVF